VTTRHKETGRLPRPVQRCVVISETCIAPPSLEHKGVRALIAHFLNRLSSSWELAILQALGRCQDPLSLWEVLPEIWDHTRSGVRA
jgi:hypothetical protein